MKEKIQNHFRKIVKGLPTTVKTDICSILYNSPDATQYLQKEYEFVEDIGKERMAYIVTFKNELRKLSKEHYIELFNSLYTDFS